MAHEVETMAFAGELPWHGLGNRVNPNTSIEDMLVASGLNWQVDKLPLYRKIGEEFRVIKDRYALTRSRDNRVLTITGKQWFPVQNAEALEFFRQYSFAGGAQLETAGSLRGGKIVWGLANLGHDFYVGKGDKVKGYLLFMVPHQVGKATTIRLVRTRVVCANTMAMAMGEKTAIEYRQDHMKKFDSEAAKKAIALSHEKLTEAEKTDKKLLKLKLSHSDTVQLLANHFQPAEEKEDKAWWNKLLLPINQNKQLTQVLNSVESAPGAMPGTGWGVLNGVTHWADHVVGRSKDTRLMRSWIGDNAKLKLAVERDLLQMAA
jgi:phage/plasmid-like protein (TIGR03299 family)